MNLNFLWPIIVLFAVSMISVKLLARMKVGVLTKSVLLVAFSLASPMMIVASPMTSGVTTGSNVECLGVASELNHQALGIPKSNCETSEFRHDFVAAENLPGQLYGIDSGVRRSVAANAVGGDTIPALIKQPGQADQLANLPLTSLRSPKATIPADSRFFDSNLAPARAGSIPPPIEVFPMSGELPGYIPISGVKLTPPQ